MTFFDNVKDQYRNPVFGVFFCSIYRKISTMKKFIEFVNNPLKMLGLGGGFFGIGMINSLMNDASSMADLDWWGKGAVIGFSIVLGALLVRFFLLPLGKWLIGLVNL